LVFVPDEETAGPRGSRMLDSTGILGKKGIGMLTPEPTGGTVWNANRGAITAKVIVDGKSAHVGRQFEGVNAFEEMIDLVAAFQKVKKEVEERKTAFDIQPERANRSILMIGGQCGGGTNFNVVPDMCYFTIDRRINPEEDLETEKERLVSLVSKSTREIRRSRIEIFQEGVSAGTPSDSQLGRILARNIERVTGVTPRFEMCPGLLETRFYASREIPAYAYGPGLLTVSHGPNEFVPISNIVACTAVYAMTALELPGK